MDKASVQIIDTNRYTISRLIKAYWHSPYRLSASLFVLAMVLLSVAGVGMDVAITYWYNAFYDSLQTYSKEWCIRLLFDFCGIAAVAIIFAVYRYYIAQRFALRWRKWLTEQIVNRWLHDRSYYYLEAFDTTTDNPDQRIQEDIGGIVNSSIDLMTGLVTAVTTFLAFIYILWSLSGNLDIPVGNLFTIHIHGYLMWVTIIYSTIGTLITFKVGRPLINLNFQQQRREADFRFAAIDLRSHAEHVALYRGEDNQRGMLYKLFGAVLDNWYLIIMRQKLLLWVTAGYNQAAVLLPLVVALPNYFNKVFQLGGLIQSLSAFGKVQDSLSYLVNAYTQIANWKAIGDRLTTFLNHAHDMENEANAANHMNVTSNKHNDIEVKSLTINTPAGTPLLKNINQSLKHGQHYLIKGPSGIGKSTFVRTLAGIWPYAAGSVSLPNSGSIMFLPQKPYMPIGSLAEALTFPAPAHSIDDAVLKQALADCNLPHLVPKLHDIAPWSQQLSPGEQQRIGFARLILQKPDWAFLDESTSMVDVGNEKAMYELVRKKLPSCSMVSIGHRPTLEAMHDQVIEMEQYR